MTCEMYDKQNGICYITREDCYIRNEFKQYELCAIKLERESGLVGKLEDTKTKKIKKQSI